MVVDLRLAFSYCCIFGEFMWWGNVSHGDGDYCVMQVPAFTLYNRYTQVWDSKRYQDNKKKKKSFRGGGVQHSTSAGCPIIVLNNLQARDISSIISKHTLISQPPKYPHPGVPLVSEQAAQPFHATCRETHWHTWLRDLDALYLIMNYASAGVTLKNTIPPVIRQMGCFCLAYAVHLLSPVWGEKHLVTHTNRACGNLPVSTVLNRQNPSGHNESEWTDLIVYRWYNVNQCKSI